MEHKCPSCNNYLFISKNKFVSDLNTTDVYSELTMVCINPKCENYCGTDLDNPIKTVKTVKNKVN